jgi:Spy/CpxP family protein refolding chaperone
MTQANTLSQRSSLFIGLGFGLAILPACGGSEPPPVAPPPPVATTAPPAPPPPPPAATAPPPAVAEAAPQPAPKHHHGHGVAGMLMASLGSLDLKPEQKTAVEAIESDLQKPEEAAKEPRAKLEGDVADGVAAGKLDHKKTDADIKALSDAVAATEPQMQDAMNRLSKALDADQRKKLVETMREKGKEMKEHMAEHEGKGPGMGMGKEHEGKGPGMGKEHEGKGPGMGKEHEGKGPGMGMGMGKEHEGKGPGMGKEHEGHEHEGMAEGPLMKLSDELGLTPEQKTQLHTKLDAQMKANQAAMKPKMDAMGKHMDAVGSAFEGDKFDAKKAGVGSQAKDMVKAIATARVQFVETVLAVLTPDQRTKFAQHLKIHANDNQDGMD